VFLSLSAFLHDPISGIKKTKHAIKKRTLPTSDKISLFFRLDARKKRAQMINIIQPAK
jgi:hypothetical protein